MTIILISLIAYVAASAWDVGHVNDLLDKMVNPGRSRSDRRPVPAPAPRLVINLPSAQERH